MKKLKLISKTEIKEDLKVYDIEVADSHHYILENGIISHNSIGSFVGGDTISGGGGGKYSPSIIFTLTKSKMEDKESEEYVKKIGIEGSKIGIVITLWPYKQRFARPIAVKIHIPFYKKPNPYVGLERFVNWETCGVIRGRIHTQKEYEKLDKEEKKVCFNFEGFDIVEKQDEPGKFDKVPNEKIWVEPRSTAKYLVCKHTGGLIPITELFTSKVFTQEVLKELDENIIKKTFMLPSIESLEDLAEVTEVLINDVKSEDNIVESDNITDLFLEE